MKRWACTVVAVGLVVARTGASAVIPPALDIRIERDPRPGAIYSALAVNLRIFVTERATGAVPADDFEVYAFARRRRGRRPRASAAARNTTTAPRCRGASTPAPSSSTTADAGSSTVS